MSVLELAKAGSRKCKFKLRLDDWCASDSDEEKRCPRRCGAGGVVALCQKEIRVSSLWFDNTEPPRTTVMQGELTRTYL